MNINPAHQSGLPYLPSPKGVVPVVSPTARTRDAADQAEPQPRKRVPGVYEDAAATASRQSRLHRLSTADRHAARAMQAYDQVSRNDAGDELRQLLGLDEFA